MNWKIGQKIVCVQSHSKRATIAGYIYTIKNITECGCGRVSLDVGVLGENNQTTCSDCGRTIGVGPIWWQGAPRFKPIEYSGNAISEILEKFKPAECRPDVEVIPEKLISNH